MSEWPDTTALARRELMLYLEAASRTDPSLPTRCPPWTVRDITAHLAATFERFGAMLRQSRAGDLTPPFAPEELSDENLRAVAEFTGDSEVHLADEAERFIEMATDMDELTAHQRGPTPVGANLLFGLFDLVVHHDDIAVAAGGSYRPGADVVAALDEMSRKMGMYGNIEPDPDADVWPMLLRASGRE